MFVDLMSLLRAWSCVLVRRGDITPWERREVLAIGVGGALSSHHESYLGDQQQVCWVTS